MPERGVALELMRTLSSRDGASGLAGPCQGSFALRAASALYLSVLSLPGNVFLRIVDLGKRLTSSSVLTGDPPGRKPSSPARLSMSLGSGPSFHTCVFHAAFLIL